MSFFDDLLRESDLIEAEHKGEISTQKKWFLSFLNGFSENEEVITSQHINTEDNIFNQYSRYIKETKSTLFSLLNNDLKYLSSIESTPFTSFDSLRFAISISRLILYLYYFFLHKHESVYLTSEMLSPENSLINIVSVSHIDYIIYIFESICSNSLFISLQTTYIMQ